MMDLNIADVFILIVIAISTLVGIYRGFIRELITIITWIIAGMVAYMYGKVVGEYFFFVDSSTTKEILGMVVVFIGVVFVGFLVKLIVLKAGKISGVSPLDRITGALFGALRGCLIIILVLLASTTNITKQPWYKGSKMLPKFTKVADVVANTTPKTWREDLSKEVDEVMKAEQPPAPVSVATPAVTAAQPTSGTASGTATTSNTTPSANPNKNKAVSKPASVTTPVAPVTTVTTPVAPVTTVTTPTAPATPGASTQSSSQ